MNSYCLAAVSYNGNKLRKTPVGVQKIVNAKGENCKARGESFAATSEKRNRGDHGDIVVDTEDCGSIGETSVSGETSLPRSGFVYHLDSTRFEIREVDRSERRKKYNTSENSNSRYQNFKPVRLGTFAESETESESDSYTDYESEERTDALADSSAESESTVKVGSDDNFELEETRNKQSNSSEIEAIEKLDSDSYFQFQETSDNESNSSESEAIEKIDSESSFELERTSNNDTVSESDETDSVKSSDNFDFKRATDPESASFQLVIDDRNLSSDDDSNTLEKTDSNSKFDIGQSISSFSSLSSNLETDKSKTRFIDRLGNTRFEFQPREMDEIVTSYIGTRKLLVSESVTRQTTSGVAVAGNADDEGVTNPLYDASLDDDTGETKHTAMESNLHTTPADSKIDLDNLSSDGAKPSIEPQKTTTMTFRLQQPFSSSTNTQEYSSTTRTVKTYSTTSSTVTLTPGRTPFITKPVTISETVVNPSPKIEEITDTPQDSPVTSPTEVTSSSAIETYSPMNSPTTESSDVSQPSDNSYSLTFPRPSTSPPAPPEPSHPAPPSPNIPSPTEPSHPAPSTPPHPATKTTIYSPTPFTPRYAGSSNPPALPGQHPTKRLRRMNTAPPWLPSLPTQPQEPTPPPTPPSSPSPPASPPANASSPDSPPAEPKHAAPSPPDLHIPSPPSSPPPPLSPDDDDGTKEVNEDFIKKQEVSIVESSLVLSDDDKDSSLKLVESDQKLGKSEKAPMEDLIKDLVSDFPQDSDEENDQPDENTDSREQVEEPVVNKKAVVPRESKLEPTGQNEPTRSEPREQNEPKASVQNETISLPANNPNVFMKNRPREEESHAGSAADTSVPPRNARHLHGNHSDDSDESETNNTWYISPPTSSREGRKREGNRQPPVVDSQPNVWVPYTLDPISKAELEDLDTVHKTHGILKNMLRTEIGEMSKEEKEGGQQVVLNDSISYTEFFRGLLYDDEEILMNNQYIPFRHAVFNVLDDWLPPPNTSTNQNPCKTNQVMTMGRAILTNHRLILISAEHQKGAELRKVDFTSDNGKPDTYQIRTRYHDTLHYRCIPLNKFHSVEMQAAVGFVKTTTVSASRMSCCSFKCLPGCDFFSKRWQAQETQSTRTNTRLVTCGVVLPPWDSRAALQIYMDPTVPLYHVKNFMLELQKNAPGLHPSFVPSFAGY